MERKYWILNCLSIASIKLAIIVRRVFDFSIIVRSSWHSLSAHSSKELGGFCGWEKSGGGGVDFSVIAAKAAWEWQREAHSGRLEKYLRRIIKNKSIRLNSDWGVVTVTHGVRRRRGWLELALESDLVSTSYCAASPDNDFETGNYAGDI